MAHPISRHCRPLQGLGPGKPHPDSRARTAQILGRNSSLLFAIYVSVLGKKFDGLFVSTRLLQVLGLCGGSVLLGIMLFLFYSTYQRACAGNKDGYTEIGESP